MPSPSRRLIFTLLAPITVPLTILFMAGANLLGGAFYIVIEATAAPLLRRPITLTRRQMALLALPVLAITPLAMFVHLLLWLLKRIGSFLCSVGHWQTCTVSRPWSFIAGLFWTIAAFWSVVACMNAAEGLGLIRMPITGRDGFVEFYARGRVLGDMPKDMQDRRKALIAELRSGQTAVYPQWEDLLYALSDDQAPFTLFPDLVMRRMAGLPWFFVPGELSRDGADHSLLLFGPLLFTGMILIRWPGQGRLIRSGWLRNALFLVRTGGAVYAIFYLITWAPRTAYVHFAFLGPPPAYTPQLPPWYFQVLSPAWWFGADYQTYVRPEWYLFNAGLWLALIAAVVFIWYLAWRISPFFGWPRYYIAFLATRLLQRKRIAFFSVGAVTLCVAMMVIVISVMGGFVDSIRNRARGLLGDLVMDGGHAGFPFYQEFIEEISRLKDPVSGKPLVVQATPIIHSYGVLQFPATRLTKPVRIHGIRLNEYTRVNEFGKDLFYHTRYGSTTLAKVEKPCFGYDERGLPALPGDMDRHYYEKYLPSLPREKREKEEKEFRRDRGELGFSGPGVFDFSPNEDHQPMTTGKPFPGLILGRDVIFHRLPSGDYTRSHNYPCGEQCLVTMLPMTRSGDVSPEPPPKPAFRYVDDSRTGIYEIDSMNVYADFEILQGLLSMDAQERAEGSELFVGGVEAALQPDLEAGRVPESLVHLLAERGYRVDAGASVQIKDAGKKWRIKNPGRDFLVVKKDDSLEILCCTTSPRCSQIQMKLCSDYGRNRVVLEEKKKLIEDAWQSFRAHVPADNIEDDLLRLVDVATWEEMQKDYISAIEKEKFLVVIMFGVISSVAVFLILCIFYMIVQEKTRDIGIIKSVGGSAEGVTAVFLAYGAAIGLVGCVIGSLLGITFVEHINDVQEFLARMNPAWRVWSPEQYSFDKIPDVWKWSEVIWISILAIFASVAGAAFPAMRAGRTWPVETLRYE